MRDRKIGEEKDINHIAKLRYDSKEKVEEIAKVMMEGEMNLVCEGKDR